MAQDDDNTKPAEKGNAKKMILMVLAGLVLLGAGVGGTLYFTGALSGAGDTTADAAVDQKEAKPVPIYFAFPEPFTVNFNTETGLRYLQVGIDVMSYDQAAIDAVQTHMPAIKNNIILLLSSQDYSELVGLEGKETLRQAVLDEIRTILDRHDVETPVEQVYFTTFVMQ